ncbi:MAG: lysophospholipid acyltransferase family protein [Pseudomonadota bacterium]
MNQTVQEALPDERPEAVASAVNPRDLSYALSAKTGLGKSVVRVTENLTGRLPVLYRLLGYDKDVAAGEAIWDVVWRRYKLSLDLVRNPAERIPATGPVVVVSNHPFGILDGMAIGKLLWDRRPDFKIVANAVFAQAPELAPHILPIDFEGDRAAAVRNLQTRRDALAYLKSGGLVSIFPGGAVASARTAFGTPYDPDWKPFAAKMASAPNVTVIPVFFVGRNSRVFEAAGRLAPALRYGLHVHEFWRRMGKPVPVAIGDPIPRAQIEARAGDPPGLMAYLRAMTYALSPDAEGLSEEARLAGPPVGRRWG